ncbi:MAG: type I restriction-modification enzyme R subunit C-terminal domain-containing protein [Prosthecobacter sp.]
MPDPEQLARQNIDAMLAAAGWAVQSKSAVNLSAQRGVAIEELSFKTGEPDYTLFVDGKALGTLEAKPEGHTLSGVEQQSAKYITGVPFGIQYWHSPLPFCYESTGKETFFTNRLDPEPCSRRVFSFHRPETLLAWVQQEKQLAQRLREFPPLITTNLWLAQIEAITNLEKSFAKGLLRALIQMATGSGKTFTAVNFIYRLVKYGGARRVLFLVDRGNLGEQTLKEFQQFVSPVNQYKFTEEYIVQHLTSNHLDSSARVVIGTIQRVFSMLKGEKEPAADLDDLPLDAAAPLFRQPEPIRYNPDFPIEEFDFIVTDECHRSIYNLWRQVLEYFDASLIGLTATPAKQTFGFFQKNLVMEYNHEKAVADGVNVGCDVYEIKTQITTAGSRVESGYFVDKRDRRTRAIRWEQLDEDLRYDASDLDRAVVSTDQIRTVLSTFRDRVFTEIFPGRTDLPKTLIFAKDDAHADDIVRICRQVFGKGNDFCKKITYKTTGETPKELIKAFRNSYNPRVAVTVDMIATGTDIKPLEIVFFMRNVTSRNFFDQMKGRGVRVVSETEMENVNPGVKRKTRFVIVDAVGVCESCKTETRPLDTKPGVSFEKLLDAAAFNTTETAAIESLATRLIRLERRMDAGVMQQVTQAAKGQTLSHIARGLLDALDADAVYAQAKAGKAEYVEPSEKEIIAAREARIKAALVPLSTNPELRNLLKTVHQVADQIIDVISQDKLLRAGAAPQAVQSAMQTATSFREFIVKHEAEITALHILYSRPYAQRLTEKMLKELEKKLRENHAAWTEDNLWNAFAAAHPTKVKGRTQAGRFADLVSLVRFALEQQSVLKPFADSVHERFEEWLRKRDQDAAGKLETLNLKLETAESGTVAFSPHQLAWLRLIRDQIAISLSIEPEDFDSVPFNQHGGLGRAYQLFGDQLPKLLEELNEALAA